MLILQEEAVFQWVVASGVVLAFGLLVLVSRFAPQELGNLVPRTLLYGQVLILVSKWPAVTWISAGNRSRWATLTNHFGWLFLLTMTMILAVGTWRFRRKPTVYAKALCFGLLAFTVAQISSSIYAEQILFPEAYLPMLLVILGLSLFPMTFETALREMLVTLGLFCGLGLLMFVLGVDWVELATFRRTPIPFVDGRLQGLVAHPNFLAPFASMGLVLVIANFKKTRIPLALCFGLTLWMTDTRTQMLASIVAVSGIGFYEVRHRREWRAWSSLLAAGIGALFLAVILLIGSRVQTATTSGVGDSLSEFGRLNGRTSLWPHAIRYWESSPIVGVGPRAFDLEFRLTNKMLWAHGAHNQVLQTLAAEGLLGLLTLVYVAIACGIAIRSATGRAQLSLVLVALVILFAFATETPLRLTASIPHALFASVLVALFVSDTYTNIDQSTRRRESSKN